MNNTTTFYSLYKMFILNITMEATTSECTEADSSATKLKLLRSVANWIGIKLTGIIIIMGIITNFISFVIIVKSDLKRTSIGIYLAGLSVFDTLVLVTTGTDNLMYIFSISRSSLFCKLYFIFIFSSNFVSAWILAVMTCERCYVITNPYSMISNETLRKRAFQIIILITIFAISLYIHLSVTYDYIAIPKSRDISANQTYFYRCSYKNEFQYFGFKIFSWIHLSAFCAVPATVIFICNVIIIIFMVKYTRKKDIKRSKSKNLEGTSKLTTMLLMNSFFILFTTLPIVSYFYIAKQIDVIVWESLRAINLLNYSCNFFIYLLSGKKFRDEAKKLFNCGCWSYESASHSQTKVSTVSTPTRGE